MSLAPLKIPGLLVTGTDTDVGKTIIAGAIANWFALREKTVAVLKPVATGCVRRREGLVSEDAEFLAVCAASRHPLDLICPQRYAEPLAPSVAARRAKQPLDWEAIQRSIRLMSPGSDVMIVEGAGGVMAPMDDKHLVMDVARMLNIPAIVVARPALGTINHTLLSVRALQSVGVRVAGIVINRYPTDSPGIAEETNPREIEKWSKLPVLAMVPDEPAPAGELAPGIVSAIGMVDWQKIVGESPETSMTKSE